MSVNKMKNHTRTERIRKLRRMLNELQENPVAFTKKYGYGWDGVIARFCIEEGVSWRTAKEYEKLLRMAGEI